MVYPESYTEEQWAVVRRYLFDRFGENDFLISREGTLCRAGMDVIFVEPDGTAVSCPGTRTYNLGNLLNGTLRTLDGPRPCLSAICQCPDLWQLNEV
jgi:MoaA/NifB/PqqE/SkfB family radical SAM enzyme